MTKKLISITPEACQRYSLSRATIYNLIRDGVLKPVKIGRCTRLSVEQADAALLGQNT